MKNKFFGVFAIAALLVTLPSVHAGGKRTPTPKQAPDTIAAISADSITVKHIKNVPPSNPGGKFKEETSTKIYKITASTSVTIDGEPAKIADLKEGMAVNVSSESSGPPGADNIAGVANEISAHNAK